LKKQNKNRKSNPTKEDRTNQKLQDNRKTELKSLEKGQYPLIQELPIDIQMRLKNFFSKTFDEQIDLIINLSGKYINEQQRAKMKKKAETDLLKPMEQSIINGYNTALKLREKYQQKKSLDSLAPKEIFYSTTDFVLQSSNVFSIPKNVHAWDHLFQVCEELQREFRFEISYLENTKYNAYVREIDKIVADLKRKKQLPQVWNILMKFFSSDDFYFIVQSTLQKLGKYYSYLEKDFPQVDKKVVDRYLEIYMELAGIYEKVISLISALIQTAENYNFSCYERKKDLAIILSQVKKAGHKTLITGFDRNIRNSLAHKTFKVNIIDHQVEFIDRKKKVIMSFNQVQNRTRELSALLLILPHVIVDVFCSLITEVKEMLESPPR
jgi:hypothetical protein